MFCGAILLARLVEVEIVSPYRRILINTSVDNCRGDGSRAGNGTWILFINNGAGTTPQTGTHFARSLDPAKPRNPAKLSDPAEMRRLGLNN